MMLSSYWGRNDDFFRTKYLAVRSFQQHARLGPILQTVHCPIVDEGEPAESLIIILLLLRDQRDRRCLKRPAAVLLKTLLQGLRSVGIRIVLSNNERLSAQLLITRLRFVVAVVGPLVHGNNTRKEGISPQVPRRMENVRIQIC